MLYIAVDGTGVPMIPAETEGRDGKGDDGRAHTREVKLCCCFTQTSLDERRPPGPRPAILFLPGHLRARRAASGS